MALTQAQEDFIKAFTPLSHTPLAEALAIVGWSERRLKSERNKSDEFDEAVSELTGTDKNGVATTTAIKKFWTKVIVDDDMPVAARLRASEMIAKTHGIFVEKKTVDINTNINHTIRHVAIEDRVSMLKQQIIDIEMAKPALPPPDPAKMVDIHSILSDMETPVHGTDE
jgi:hypothetical protein